MGERGKLYTRYPRGQTNPSIRGGRKADRYRPKEATETNYLNTTATVEEGDNILVVSFDGSDRVKRKSGAYSAIVCKLPEWTIVKPTSEYEMDLTVNTDECRGLFLGFDLFDRDTRGRIIICGDFNLMIYQMWGDID